MQEDRRIQKGRMCRQVTHVNIDSGQRRREGVVGIDVIADAGACEEGTNR
jgi:hypothetical protein